MFVVIGKGGIVRWCMLVGIGKGMSVWLMLVVFDIYTYTGEGKKIEFNNGPRGYGP
jgi:hypothetical protein